MKGSKEGGTHCEGGRYERNNLPLAIEMLFYLLPLLEFMKTIMENYDFLLKPEDSVYATVIFYK
jgi:hypothetical protein